MFIQTSAAQHLLSCKPDRPNAICPCLRNDRGREGAGTCLLLRGSRASRTPDMSNSRTCRLSWGRAMILWPTHTLILQRRDKRRLGSKQRAWQIETDSTNLSSREGMQLIFSWLEVTNGKRKENIALLRYFLLY